MVRNRESLVNTIIPLAIMAKSENAPKIEDRREPSPKANREATLKRVREENVGLMRRGDELWCVFVCVRVIFVSRRLAEARRVKRCARRLGETKGKPQAIPRETSMRICEWKAAI